MKSLTIVLFGGTGDLAKKKIIPAIIGLVNRKVIDQINLISTGRRPLTIDEYENIVGFKKDVTTENIKLHYIQMDFEKNKTMHGLKDLVLSIEDETCIGRLFYLATSPKYFEHISKELSGCCQDKKIFSRIMIEKPFGYDLKSSKKLNKSLTKYLDDENIYRVDHYLGKETIQNLLSLRLANPFFERTWNSNFIESINIIVSEDMGVGNRMEYYDHTGAIRDMIQNHLLQILSFVLMEAPKSTDPKEIHKEKVFALKKLTYTSIDVGQYEGYKKELETIKKTDSDTETYVKLILKPSAKRWKGTKIVLITGKNLKEKYAKIELNYKKEPCNIYCDINTHPNKLVLNVQPKQDVDFYMNTFIPSLEMEIKNVNMTFCKECVFVENSPESYEVILEECIKGKKTLFISNNELEVAWKLVDKIRKDMPRPKIYPKGLEAEKIMQVNKI